MASLAELKDELARCESATFTGHGFKVRNAERILHLKRIIKGLETRAAKAAAAGKPFGAGLPKREARPTKPVVMKRMCRTCGDKFTGEAHHDYCSQNCYNAHNFGQPERHQARADKFNARQAALAAKTPQAKRPASKSAASRRTA